MRNRESSKSLKSGATADHSLGSGNIFQPFKCLKDGAESIGCEQLEIIPITLEDAAVEIGSFCVEASYQVLANKRVRKVIRHCHHGSAAFIPR